MAIRKQLFVALEQLAADQSVHLHSLTSTSVIGPLESIIAIQVTVFNFKFLRERSGASLVLVQPRKTCPNVTERLLTLM